MGDIGDLVDALIGYGLRHEFEQEVRTRPELLMKGHHPLLDPTY